MALPPPARPGAIPAEAWAALHAARRCLGPTLLAAYLHGSAVAGGLRPDSDVDILVIVDRPTSRAVRTRLAAELLAISGRWRSGDAARPIELIVLCRSALGAAYPRRLDFVYGEWLRDQFEAGEVPEPGPDPELSILLAQARDEGQTLAGPAARDLLPTITEDELRRAIADTLPPLVASLPGDERNVLLQLARMWYTLAMGEIVPKDVAAEWAAARLPRPAADILGQARQHYLAGGPDDWHTLRATYTATVLRDRVAALLPTPTGRL